MISDSITLSTALEAALALPRQAQPAAIEAVRRNQWGKSKSELGFGANTLFDA